MLKEAKDSLLKSGCDAKNSDELLIINYLLNVDCKIKTRDVNEDFARVFRENGVLFDDIYSDYMKYIIECQDKQSFYRDNEYKNLEVSYEYIMAKLDDFIESLDPEWYKLFSTLYNNRHDIIKLSDSLTETLYFPSSDLWLANIERTDTIKDYANIAQAYGEGIGVKMRRNGERTFDDRIFIVAFARAIQYLFMAKLDDFGIQREVTKFFINDYNATYKMVNSVCDKFALHSIMSNPQSAKEVAAHLEQVLHRKVDKQVIEDAYKRTVKRDIQSILADLITRELLLVFESDKEKFIYDMNALVKSENTPAKTLEKLDINLNSIYYR